MSRLVGTVVRGIRGPIINQGDNLAELVTSAVLAASESEGFQLRDKDVLGITESVVARAQGNYATADQIASDIRKKFKGDCLGLVFPITSRNRFSILLRGIARGARKIVLQLSYPTDEVGNHLITEEALVKSGVNAYTQLLTEEEFRKTFGDLRHPFTGMDYIQFYKDIIRGEGCEVEVILSNRIESILNYTDEVLACDIHSRKRSCERLREAGAKTVYGIHQILTESVDGSGYNELFGLLGSNKATEESVKLFPRESGDLVKDIQKRLKEKTGKTVEVMIYGDGAFKDPVGKIWELADPVVSPAYTDGLKGTPHELKLKYLADNEFHNLDAEAQRKAILERIRNKEIADTDSMAGQGTTPRQLTDLLGSLCDLTSGSGDKGTPFVYIQGYFDSLATE